MNFENAFLGLRSIQVRHLRSKMPLAGIDWLRGQPRLILRGQRVPRPRTACTAQLGRRRAARQRGRRAGLGWRAHGSCGGAVSLTGRAQGAERRRGVRMAMSTRNPKPDRFLLY